MRTSTVLHRSSATQSQQADEEDPGMISLKRPSQKWQKPPAVDASEQSAALAPPRRSFVAQSQQQQQQVVEEDSGINAPKCSSWQKPPSADALKKADSTTAEEKRDSLKDAPYQLRHIKQNWNLSYVPKGAVAERMKLFSGHADDHKFDELELTNTGRTNPALRKRREMERQQELERQKELEEKRKRAQSKYGFGRTKKQKDMAATAMQSIVRMHFAKAVIARKKEMAEARARKETQLAIERAELELKSAAAIKIQAVMRSTVTRMRVCRMVDGMIEEMLRKERSEERRLIEMEAEAAALVAAKIKAQEEEAQRQAQAAEAERRRLRELEEQAAALEEEKRKHQLAESERLALAALAREGREAAAAELSRQKAEEEAEKEAQRLAQIESERASRNDQSELERERRRKALNLFTGPLPWGVGLMPDWWMAEVPHNELFLDRITEEDNGDEFEEWRKVNMSQEAYN